MVLTPIQVLFTILIITNISLAAHSSESSEQYHVGISWQGSSLMAERVLSGLQKTIADYAPEIHLDIRGEQTDLEALEGIISYFEKTKDAMVIFRSNGAQLLGARGAMIPAFVGSINNPIELGVTSSVTHPDKNITGVTYSLPTLIKLEAFRQIYPDMQRFVLLVEDGHPGTPIDVRETEIAARKLGLQGRVVYCQTLDDVLETVSQNGRDEIIILGIQALIMDNVTQIVKAAGNRIVFSYSEQAVEQGALAGIVADDHKLGQMLGQMLIEKLINEKPISQIPILTDPEPRLKLNYTTLERFKHQIPFSIYSLAKSEQMLQTLLVSAPTGIYRIENKVIAYVNDYILNLTGYNRNELVGNSARVLFVNDQDYTTTISYGSRNHLITPETGEFRWMHKNGNILHVLVSAAVIEPVDINGSYTITVIDITDKKNTEAKLSAITNWFLAGLTFFIIILLILMARLISSLRQRKQTMESLHKSETQFRSLFQNAADAIFIVNIHTGKILDANQAAEQLMKLPVGKIIGRDHTSLHPTDRWEEARVFVDKYIKELKTPGTPTPLEFELLSNDGNIIQVEVRASTVNYKGEECIMGNFRDITERKKAEEEIRQKTVLEKKVEVAEESLKFKQNFLANMSHEIRTPLTGIMGMTDILEQTALDENQLDYLHTIKFSGEQLKEIINQVLDFSKIEAGKITLKPSVFRYSTLMDDTLMLFSNTVKKGVYFHIKTDPRIPGCIIADKNRISQVINNLVSNALKFTEIGHVTVKSSLHSQPDAHNEFFIKIEVIDTGIGIQDHLHEMLFTPFTQAEENDTRKFEGTGLGLSICKDLAKLLGGEIGVESEYGKGSTFWFTLKALAVADPHLDISLPAKADKHSRKLNILCAEDKLVNQKVITLMLKGLGHEVTIAGDGQQLLNMYEAGKYDLILMDIQMPVMDGITATGNLREKHIDLPPIVGLSANAFEGDREKYLSLGLDEYLIKPFKKSDFNDLIDKLYPAKQS